MTTLVMDILEEFKESSRKEKHLELVTLFVSTTAVEDPLLLHNMVPLVRKMFCFMCSSFYLSC